MQLCSSLSILWHCLSLGVAEATRGLQEICVATREDSGVLGFPSRRGLAPRGILECNPDEKNPMTDPSSKATLWVKAQHEGALPPPGIVRKDPRSQFSCSVMSVFATPWTAAHQASLSITNFQSLLAQTHVH